MNHTADYTYNDLKRAYSMIGVKKGRVLYLETDLASCGLYETMDKVALPEAHLSALKELVGKNGTIVISSASESLCNTKKVFDRKRTPGEMGVLSEYIRRQKGSVRSFHPFVSFVALGKEAGAICGDVPRHAFGPKTPMARMMNRDALFLSVGFHPRITCETVHQAEMDAGVPYRYVREYMHPVRRARGVKREPFYLYVWYYECGIKKDYNKKIWKSFESKHRVKEARLGRGKVYSYSMREFYEHVMYIFKNDMYVLLEKIPGKKPYRRKM